MMWGSVAYATVIRFYQRVTGYPVRDQAYIDDTPDVNARNPELLRELAEKEAAFITAQHGPSSRAEELRRLAAEYDAIIKASAAPRPELREAVDEKVKWAAGKDGGVTEEEQRGKKT